MTDATQPGGPAQAQAQASNPAAAQPGIPGAPAQPNQAAQPNPAESSVELEAPKGSDADGKITYNETPYPGLNVALDFLGGLGIGPENAAMQAAMDGNFAQLEGLLQGMGDKAKGYDKIIALAKEAYNTIQTETKALAVKNAETIHKAVGGEENWKAIKEWASANAEPEEREAVNKALGSGGIQAKAMALYLQALHAKASGVVKQPAEATSGARGASTGAGEPLSSQAYGRAVYQLQMEKGPGFRSTPEYASLAARFQAGQRLNLG